MKRNGRQKATKWRPSPHQAKVLEVARECALQKSISAIAIESRVSRQSIHEWLRDDPDFIAVWEDLPRETIKNHMPGIVQALVRRALDGDVNAIKLALEMGKLYTPPVQEHKHNHAGSIDLSVLSDDDLQGLEEVYAKLAGRGGTAAVASGEGTLTPQAN